MHVLPEPRQGSSRPHVCLSGFGFCCNNLQNHWLTVRNERPLIAGRRHKERQFHSLHCGFDAPQRVAPRCVTSCVAMLLAIALDFGEGELVERQKQTLFSRQFDFDRARVRVARPTLRPTNRTLFSFAREFLYQFIPDGPTGAKYGVHENRPSIIRPFQNSRVIRAVSQCWSKHRCYQTRNGDDPEGKA